MVTFETSKAIGYRFSVSINKIKNQLDRSRCMIVKDEFIPSLLAQISVLLKKLKRSKLTFVKLHSWFFKSECTSDKKIPRPFVVAHEDH